MVPERFSIMDLNPKTAITPAAIQAVALERSKLEEQLDDYIKADVSGTAYTARIVFCQTRLLTNWPWTRFSWLASCMLNSSNVGTAFDTVKFQIMVREQLNWREMNAQGELATVGTLPGKYSSTTKLHQYWWGDDWYEYKRQNGKPAYQFFTAILHLALHFMVVELYVNARDANQNTNFNSFIDILRTYYKEINAYLVEYMFTNPILKISQMSRRAFKWANPEDEEGIKRIRQLAAQCRASQARHITFSEDPDNPSKYPANFDEALMWIRKSKGRKWNQGASEQSCAKVDKYLICAFNAMNKVAYNPYPGAQFSKTFKVVPPAYDIYQDFLKTKKIIDGTTSSTVPSYSGASMFARLANLIDSQGILPLNSYNKELQAAQLRMGVDNFQFPQTGLDPYEYHIQGLPSYHWKAELAIMCGENAYSRKKLRTGLDKITSYLMSHTEVSMVPKSIARAWDEQEPGMQAICDLYDMHVTYQRAKVARSSAMDTATSTASVQIATTVTSSTDTMPSDQLTAIEHAAEDEVDDSDDDGPPVLQQTASATTDNQAAQDAFAATAVALNALPPLTTVGANLASHQMPKQMPSLDEIKKDRARRQKENEALMKAMGRIINGDDDEDWTEESIKKFKK